VAAQTKQGTFKVPAIKTADDTKRALAALEKAKARLTPRAYAQAKEQIKAASKALAGPKDDGLANVRRRGLHLRIGTDGTIEVRHSTDGEESVLLGDSPVHCAPIEIACADWTDDTTEARWIQLAVVGHWEGHPAGPFDLNEGVFAEIDRNFRATKNRRIPIDFEHASESAATDGSIPTVGAPAQGWIIDLDNRGSAGLWGLVQWGELARQYIREGKYRYISPAIRFNARDRVTKAHIGTRLTSAGLTNQPFLDGMQPLAASDKITAGDTMNQQLMSAGEFMPRLRAALKLGELSTYTECQDQLSRLKAMCAMAEHPEATHEGVSLAEYVSPLKAMMNLPANAQYADLFEAVEAMIEDAIARHESTMHGPGDDDAPPSSRDMSDTQPATMADTTQETAMADADLQIKLNETTTKLTAADSQVVTLSARVNELELTLKAVQAERDTALSEKTALLSEKEARDNADIEREVVETITFHGKAKGLTMSDKDALISMRKSSPAAFGKLYPVAPPEQRHLTSRITDRSSDPKPTEIRTVEPTPSLLALSERTDAFVAKGMDREDAVLAALKEASAN